MLRVNCCLLLKTLMHVPKLLICFSVEIKLTVLNLLDHVPRGLGKHYSA